MVELNMAEILQSIILRYEISTRLDYIKIQKLNGEILLLKKEIEKLKKL